MPLTGNLFQSQLDATSSPLLTTPSPLKQLPMTPQTPALGASLHQLPGAGGLNLSKLVSSLGGTAMTARPASALPAPVHATPVTSNDPSLRASAPSSSGWVQGVVRAAHQAGVDPVRAVAIALEESGGDPHAVGDQGSSYGLFQLHKGGALGSLTPQQAQDPYTNAMAVLPSWGKLGGGKGLSDQAALMQYYSRVGRGSSNEIPTEHALAKLDQARSLVGGLGGGGGQTLMERTATQGTPGGGGLSQGTFGALLNYAAKIQKDALAGKAPDLGQVMQMVDPIMKAIMAPTGEVQAGHAPPVDPGSSGREQIATQAALSVLGTPYKWGGTDPEHGIDCSALVQWAWGKAGVSLPRTTYEQIKVGQSVPNLAAAQPGDILFPTAEHEMLYLGGGIAVESPHTGASVRQTNVAGRTFLAIRRPG